MLLTELLKKENIHFQSSFQLHHPYRGISPAGCLTNFSFWKVCAVTSAEMQISEDVFPLFSPPLPSCSVIFETGYGKALKINQSKQIFFPFSLIVEK